MFYQSGYIIEILETIQSLIQIPNSDTTKREGLI
jgi:hypothetical protein